MPNAEGNAATVEEPCLVEVSRIEDKYKRRPYVVELEKKTSEEGVPENSDPLAKNYFLQLVWLTLSIVRHIDQKVETIKPDKALSAASARHKLIKLWFVYDGQEEKCDDNINMLPCVLNRVLRNLRDAFEIKYNGNTAMAEKKGSHELVLLARYTWADCDDRTFDVSFPLNDNLETLVNNYYSSRQFEGKTYDAFSAFVLTTQALFSSYQTRRKNAYAPEDWRAHEVFWYLDKNNEEKEHHGKTIDYKPLTVQQIVDSITNLSMRARLEALLEPLMKARKEYFTHLRDNDLVLPYFDKLTNYIDVYHEFQKQLLRQSEAFRIAIVEKLDGVPFSALDILQNLDSKFKGHRIKAGKNEQETWSEKYAEDVLKSSNEESLEKTLLLLNGPEDLSLLSVQKKLHKCKGEYVEPVLKPLPHHPLAMHALHVAYRFISGYALLNDTYTAPRYDTDALLTRTIVDFIAYSRAQRNLELSLFFQQKEFQLLLDCDSLVNFCHAYPVGSAALETQLEVVRLTEKIIQHACKNQEKNEIHVLIEGNWSKRGMIYRALYLVDFFQSRFKNGWLNCHSLKAIHFEIRSKKHILTTSTDFDYTQTITEEQFDLNRLPGFSRVDNSEPGLAKYADSDGIKALDKNYDLLFVLGADQILLEPSKYYNDLPSFLETISNSSYKEHMGIDVWRRSYHGMWDLRDVKTNEYAKVYRFLGAKAACRDKNNPSSTSALVYNKDVIQRISRAVLECQKTFEAYYYVLHSGSDIISDQVRNQSCFETERYDGRDVNILHFCSNTQESDQIPEQDDCIDLDAWQMLKAAQSKTFYLLRRCHAVNNILPGIPKGKEFDTAGKVAFIQAMKNYCIHLHYEKKDDKIEIYFSRKMEDAYKAYFNNDEKKCEVFDRQMSKYLNYLVRVLKDEVPSGTMERVLKQTLLLPIYSRCETPEDLLVYDLLLNRRDDSLVEIHEIEDSENEGSCSGHRHIPMSNINYYSSLVACCNNGSKAAWERLQNIEKEDIKLSHNFKYLEEEEEATRQAPQLLRERALRQLKNTENTIAVPIPPLYQSVTAALLDLQKRREGKY